MFHSCRRRAGLGPRFDRAGRGHSQPHPARRGGDRTEGLKHDFGAKLCFHGGIDIQYLLPLEPAATVRAEARRHVEILGKGGGYILAPSHNLQQDISTENIRAMYALDLRAPGAAPSGPLK